MSGEIDELKVKFNKDKEVEELDHMVIIFVLWVIISLSIIIFKNSWISICALGLGIIILTGICINLQEVKNE